LSGGRRFFDTQEVADLISYLHVLANPRNTIAKTAVLRSPFGALSDAQIYAGEGNAWLESLLESQRRRMDTAPPEVLLREALDGSGYGRHPEPGVEANIEKFLRLVREAWQERPRNMPAFVEHIETLRAAADEQSAPIPTLGDAVNILTVHASKGLEFPVVFVAGCYFSPPGNRASLSYSAAGQLGLRFTNPEDGRQYPDLAARVNAQTQKEEDDEELARMLYVALTRAEQKLYVSWGGKQRRGWAKFLLGQETPPYAGDVSEPPEEEAEVVERRPVVARPLGARRPGLSSAAPSHLALYAECPQRYYLDEVVGLKPRGTAAANLGTQVHQWLAGQLEEASTEVVALAARAKETPLAGLLQGARQVEREYDFVFAYAGIVWEGVMDLWLETAEGEIVVVDYKTGPRRDGVYDLQLALYREALRVRFPGRVVRSYLLYLGSGEWVEVSREIPGELVERFASGGDYALQPGEHCRPCPHAGKACPVKVE
jgi:ATP-dependent exoDNAse (exonuclease V) beta subunit